VTSALHRHLRANAVAYLALFVALGGTSMAAVTLKRNSVLSTHIKNGQVKRADIASGAVDSSRVANGSLQAHDFAAGQLQSGARGPAGAPGTPGANGAPGGTGARGPSFGDGRAAGQGATVPILGCTGGSTAIVTYDLTLSEPSRIFAVGSSTWTRTGGDLTQGPGRGNIRIQLWNAADNAVVAGTTLQGTAPPPGQTASMTVHGVLAEWPALTAPTTIPAGTYKLKLAAANTGGINCTMNTGTYGDAQLTHIVVGTG
jgi:hypothetical protein